MALCLTFTQTIFTIKQEVFLRIWEQSEPKHDDYVEGPVKMEKQIFVYNLLK